MFATTIGVPYLSDRIAGLRWVEAGRPKKST
jgi:hypothetical protein